MPADPLTIREQRRYKRQIMLPEIGEEGQLKLKHSRMLVIGVGGLGTPILQYLSAGGVGNIGIVDHDMVDETNLQRQILFGTNDLGKLKSIIAKERLSKLNPGTTFEIFNFKLSEKNIVELVRDHDLVFDATDNFPTRYLINDACVMEGKPWIYGAVYKYEGQLSVFNYQDGPTLRCLYPDPPEPGSYLAAEESGLLGVLPGMIGCYQAIEAIKIVTGFGDVLSGKLMTINIRTNQIETHTIPLFAGNKTITAL
jgi:molybdopterin/thiamine biosynthesis adenylyltransferase